MATNQRTTRAFSPGSVTRPSPGPEGEERTEEWALCRIGRLWVQVLRALADGQRGLDRDPSETGAPAPRGGSGSGRSSAPAGRPAPARPPARSLAPSLGSGNIPFIPRPAVAGAAARAKAERGRGRGGGDAGTRVSGAGRGDAPVEAPDAPPPAQRGRADFGPRRAGQRGGAAGARGGGGGAAGRGLRSGRPPPGLGGQHRRRPSVRPRAALDWRVAQPHAWEPPARPVPRLCAGGAPAPGEPAESSRSSPASPRGPVTLAAPPSSSWATSAPFPGPCRLSCWTPSRRPVDGSSPSSLSGGPGGSASEQGVLRGGPLSHRGPPSLAGARRRPPVALE